MQMLNHQHYHMARVLFFISFNTSHKIPHHIRYFLAYQWTIILSFVSEGLIMYDSCDYSKAANIKSLEWGKLISRAKAISRYVRC